MRGHGCRRMRDEWSGEGQLGVAFGLERFPQSPSPDRDCNLVQSLRNRNQMRTTHTASPSGRCRACKHPRNGKGFFYQLSPDELRDLDAVTVISTRPAGALLFVEQQDPKGIYLLCDGQAKLSFSSSHGKTLVLRIAKAGEVLGLLSALFGGPYEVTAEVLRPSHVAFVSNRDFQWLLRAHPGLYQRVACQMALQYKAACEQLRTVGLGSSISERMAAFLLNWSADTGVSRDGMQFTLPLNHEQMAQSIAATRESVTRTLSALSEKRLIQRHRSTFVIPSRAALAEVHLLPRRTKRAGVESPLMRPTPTVIRRRVEETLRPGSGRNGLGERPSTSALRSEERTSDSMSYRRKGA
jgi:CRP/FNR family cyclic AMP-dependent transcriptional regulator